MTKKQLEDKVVELEKKLAYLEGQIAILQLDRQYTPLPNFTPVPNVEYVQCPWCGKYNCQETHVIYGRPAEVLC